MFIYKGNMNQVTLRSHLIPVKMTNIKKQTTNAGEDAGEKKHLYTVGGNVNQ
jgi:hypothetical protein